MSDLPPIVYVIDDTESMRKALESLIRSVGLEVKTFSTPREYLLRPRSEAPSCLVLDVRLPGKSGLEFQRELAEAQLGTAIIFITGHGDIPMSVRAMKAGAIDFLTKPFRDQDLLDAIQTGLEQDRARKLASPNQPQKGPRVTMETSRGLNVVKSFSPKEPSIRTDPQVIRPNSENQIDGNPLHNEILMNLPEEECRLVFPALVFVPLRMNDVLSEAGEPIRYAYFVNSGLTSILNAMEDGKSVDVGMSGREGFVGVPLLVGFQSSASRVIVQVEGSGFRVKAATLADLLPKCPILANRLQRYVQVLALQSAQLAACNRLHLVEERLARWLLMCQDRIDSDFIPLTQESLAQALGSRRSSVNLAAGMLQVAHAITFTPGHVTLLSRSALKKAACECYSAMEQQTSRWNKESA